MVVHDCSPPDEALTSPDFVPGEWCGLTYEPISISCWRAATLRYLTFDTDYGCGVVRKLKPRAAGFPPCRSRQSGGERARVVVRAWLALGYDHRATWRLFAEPRRAAEPDHGRCVSRRRPRPRQLVLVIDRLDRAIQ